MSMIIPDIQSLSSQRNLSSSQDSLAKNVNKLSPGLPVNQGGPVSEAAAEESSVELSDSLQMMTSQRAEAQEAYSNMGLENDLRSPPEEAAQTARSQMLESPQVALLAQANQLPQAGFSLLGE